MNGVVGWLKSNILIVVFSVLIIALPVGGYFGASVWNGKIRAKAEDDLKNAKRQIDGVSEVVYTLPPITEGGEPIEDPRAPNAGVTAFYAAQRAERQAEIEQVVRRAVEFNKTGGRSLLVPGSLPGDDDEREARRKAREVVELIVGEDDQPSVYEALLEGLNAGGPAPQADAARRVVDAYEAEVDRAGGAIGSLSQDEQDELDSRMAGVRYSVYSRRAGEISVYASLDALRGGDPQQHSVIPSEEPQETPSEADTLRWQMDYWLVEDLLRAIDRANRTRDGLRTEVPHSPVKRIVAARLGLMDMPEKPASGAAANTGVQTGRTPFDRSPARPGAAAGGSSFVPTHTGRGGPDDKNGVYLVRNATLTLVVASDELVRVLESFGEANFMTVTGVRLGEVDRYADLAEGYAYGSDHVMRAEIDVEAAYLHFWLADVVPGYIAEAWGIEKPEAQADAGP